MSPQEAIEYFGTQNALAAALGVTQPTISGWKTTGQIPVPRQFQLEVVTEGKLKAERPAQ